MLKWCSYCQQFIGEVPDYDDFVISHGVCSDCERRYYPWPSSKELERAVVLRGIFRKLFEAGKRNDFEMAEHVVDRAIAAGCRPVDVLTGMIAPMLYRIGEDWKRGLLSIEGEHRFTAFCERVIRLIATKLGTTHLPPKSDQPPILLVNAPGNRHTLALQIIQLWLESRMLSVRRINCDVDFDMFMEQLAACQSKLLLISVSLVEQCDAVQAIADGILRWPNHLRPKIVVGGYAVKAGLIREIIGADLTADIRTLDFAS